MLLDTHAFLWYVLGDSQLSLTAREAIDGDLNTPVNPIQATIGGGESEVLISPASYREIAIKISLRKYILTVPYETFWRRGIGDNGFEVLPIEVRHTAKLVDLPFHHRDPFDRLLIAQAIVEGIPLVSEDPDLDKYPIKRIW